VYKDIQWNAVLLAKRFKTNCMQKTNVTCETGDTMSLYQWK